MTTEQYLRWVGGFAAGCLAALLAGCRTVGPDYRGPPDAAPLADRRGAFLRAEGVTTDQPPAAWWKAFNDPTLDGLMERAMAANTDAARSLARLAEARANLGAAHADRLPTERLDAGYARIKPSLAPFGITLPGVALNPINLYQADFDASWELDLFGRQQRAIESAADRAEAAAADLDGVRLSVAADTADAYLELRHAQALLALLQSSSTIDSKLVALTEARQIEGTASTLDVERIRAQREATLAQMPTVEAQIVAAQERLTTLTGQEPGTDVRLAAPAALPLPPSEIAVGDPAALLRRRPDVRAAERRLAADTALIGVARADLFPRVTLNGSLGLATSDIGQFGNAGPLIYTAGPSISWAVLDLPRVHARIDAAQSRRDASVAEYRGVVLRALRDAETALSRYARQMETLAARRRALRSAETAARLALQRYSEGAASALDTLDADRQRLSAEEEARAAEADLSRDYVALQKSLGLAWATR